MKKYFYTTEQVNIKYKKYQKQVLQQASKSKYFTKYKQTFLNKYHKLEQQIKELRKANRIVKNQNVKQLIRELVKTQKQAFRKALGLKKDYTIRSNQKSFIVNKNGFATIQTKKLLKPFLNEYNTIKGGISNLEQFNQNWTDIKSALDYMGATADIESFINETSLSWIRRTMNKAQISQQVSTSTFINWLKLKNI